MTADEFRFCFLSSDSENKAKWRKISNCSQPCMRVRKKPRDFSEDCEFPFFRDFFAKSSRIWEPKNSKKTSTLGHEKASSQSQQRAALDYLRNRRSE